MVPIDLAELAARESEQVEWKENVADIDDVVEALCAFANDLANLGGGYVVCGARETKDEYGFPKMIRTGLTAARLREVEGRVLTRCRERVFPPLAPLVTEVEADTPDRRILVFTQPATSAAHTVRRDNEGARHFVRVGRSTIEARNGLMLDLLVRKGAAEPWDRQPCANATERDLDLLALRDTLNQMGVQIPDSRVELFLSQDASLSPFVPPLCIREPLTGIVRPRNFTMLLFGRNVQRFVPGAFCLFSIYPGVDRSDAHAERHELAGSLIDQARRLRGLLDGQSYTVFDKTDRATPNAVKYPQRALYEAMGNALAHRDYTMVDPVRITAFADRLEFLSPGALPLGVDPAAFERGQALPKWRNQALAWFFSRLQLAQAEGQGIPTILRTMREEGCPPPVFRADPQAVACILPAHPRHTLRFAMLDALPAIAQGQTDRARDRLTRVSTIMDTAEQNLPLDASYVVELCDAVSRDAVLAEEFRGLSGRLLAQAARSPLSESVLARAADVCLRYQDIDTLLLVIERQAKFASEKSARFAHLAGDLLLRAAVQAKSQLSGRDPDSQPRALVAAQAATQMAQQFFRKASALAPEGDDSAERGAALARQAAIELAAMQDAERHP